MTSETDAPWWVICDRSWQSSRTFSSLPTMSSIGSGPATIKETGHRRAVKRNKNKGTPVRPVIMTTEKRMDRQSSKCVEAGLHCPPAKGSDHAYKKKKCMKNPQTTLGLRCDIWNIRPFRRLIVVYLIRFKTKLCVKDARFQIYTMPSAMPNFRIFRRSLNTAPGQHQRG